MRRGGTGAEHRQARGEQHLDAHRPAARTWVERDGARTHPRPVGGRDRVGRSAGVAADADAAGGGKRGEIGG